MLLLTQLLLLLLSLLSLLWLLSLLSLLWLFTARVWHTYSKIQRKFLIEKKPKNFSSKVNNNPEKLLLKLINVKTFAAVGICEDCFQDLALSLYTTLIFCLQAALLSIHFLEKMKTSSVAPPRGTWLRTHHWLKDRKEKREKNSPLPVAAGIEPGTSQSIVQCATTWATTTAPYST